MLTFHAIGDWARGQVSVDWTPSTRPLVGEIETLIDQAWKQARARPGVHLFDGPMCRLESWEASPASLRLRLSPTSYRVFLGTNLIHPELADSHPDLGRRVLANPVGVSPALLSGDGWIMMGRRNSSVAYYPERVHPFAGALEPRDGGDAFATLVRELREELAFTETDILAGSIHCTGIAEDQAIRQPELILRLEATLTRAQIEAKLDAMEHSGTWAVQATAQGIEDLLAGDLCRQLTPVAVAALLLWGRVRFGDAWFARQCDAAGTNNATPCHFQG